MLYTKNLGEMLQLVQSERLGEDVGDLPISSNISKFDFTAQDPLTHKVIMHLDVLSASMEHKVFGQLHAIDVVTIDRDRGRYFDP